MFHWLLGHHRCSFSTKCLLASDETVKRWKVVVFTDIGVFKANLHLKTLPQKQGKMSGFSKKIKSPFGSKIFLDYFFCSSSIWISNYIILVYKNHHCRSKCLTVSQRSISDLKKNIPLLNIETSCKCCVWIKFLWIFKSIVHWIAQKMM